MHLGQLRSSSLTTMGLFVAIFSALLLSGFCTGGPASLTLQSGTCWIMGNLHYTFDGHYYTFMGNCTYTLAKNCHVDGTHPAFAVEGRNMNVGKTQVPFLGTIAVSVYGINIELVRLEFGYVRVNYQKWTLPISLNNGKVTLSLRGLFVVMETDFGLTLKYDWSDYLAITVPGSFAGNVCGMCGNFNTRKEDDFTTPSGSVAGSVSALGQSWRVAGATGDANCRNNCTGLCTTCTVGLVQNLEYKIFCKALVKNFVELLGCMPELDMEVFQNNCMLDLCKGETTQMYLCNTLHGYADICWKSGAKVPNWRISTQCSPPKGPEHSHYDFCGNGCPATCADLHPPANCNYTCVETQTCDDGYLLSGIKCVLKSECGCMYGGFYVEPGATFWGDDTCTEQYTCNAGGHLSIKSTGCPSGQQCQVVGGLRGCYVVNEATCMVSGDPHFVTFDGQRYNFQGTCVYEMAGVSPDQTNLESFSVLMYNTGQDKKIGSVVQMLKVKVYGYSLVISKEHPVAVLVNGELSYFPVTLANSKLQLYTSGWFGVIETDFGLKVYYNWNSVAFVTVPSTFKGAMQGMCGNYNLNPKDDMRMRNGSEAATAEELGQSWKVGTVPGCVDGCRGPCPGCNATQQALYKEKSYCGLISDPAGPFRDCHSIIDPAGFLSDCVYDVCLYQGRSNMQCKTLTAYTAACQLKGITVYPWRSDQFCAAQCPSNSHYELCTSGCPNSCQSDPALPGCGGQCMERCVCDVGFLLSGDECVPADQCGCMYQGKYFHHGQVFYPDALCQKECTCNGTVQCQNSSCGLGEQCQVKNNVRSCQPLGKGLCSISGDPHYHTFDNSTYDFQGTCTYIAAESCHLSGTRLTSFSVMVENDKWYRLSPDPKVSVTKLVAVEVYGMLLILRRNDIGMVWVNGVLHHLPQNLGGVKVYQEGHNDVIMTDFGLRVTYDLVYHVTVTVPSSYRGKTCGLCGNFNGDQSDEFQLPYGNMTKDVQAFGAAWKVSVPGAVCEDGCTGNLCPKCDDSQKPAIEEKCAIISDPNGPFAACHGLIDPVAYFRDCVYDVCLAKGDQRTVCDSVAAYMLDCQDFGVKIESWRSASFCPFACAANSHYEICALPCTTPCPGLRETDTCTQACVEGCVCDNGFYNNGTGCVPVDQCSCYYKGQTIKVGDSIITDNCQRIHSCQTSGALLSKEMMCDPNESCIVKNGKMGCYRQQCSLETNGTLTAFSGDITAITEPGAYDVLKNCNQTADWFRVVAKLEVCSNGVNTLLAVYVYFDDATITINNKHDVWINGKMMTQSTFSKNNITVRVSDNTVNVTSTSSVQLLFSSINELTISVSDEVANTLCGACGKLKPVDTTLQSLRERVLGSFHTLTPTFASLNTNPWIAPDFPKCDG